MDTKTTRRDTVPRSVWAGLFGVATLGIMIWGLPAIWGTSQRSATTAGLGDIPALGDGGVEVASRWLPREQRYGNGQAAGPDANPFPVTSARRALPKVPNGPQIPVLNPTPAPAPDAEEPNVPDADNSVPNPEITQRPSPSHGIADPQFSRAVDTPGESAPHALAQTAFHPPRVIYSEPLQPDSASASGAGADPAKTGKTGPAEVIPPAPNLPPADETVNANANANADADVSEPQPNGNGDTNPPTPTPTGDIDNRLAPGEDAMDAIREEKLPNPSAAYAAPAREIPSLPAATTPTPTPTPTSAPVNAPLPDPVPAPVTPRNVVPQPAVPRQPQESMLGRGADALPWNNANTSVKANANPSSSGLIGDAKNARAGGGSSLGETRGMGQESAVAAGPGTGQGRSAASPIRAVMGPPKASARVEGMVSPGLRVILDARGSSGGGLRYRWIQLQGGAVPLQDPTSATPTFMVPEASGNLVFLLVVSNEAGIDNTTLIVPIETGGRKLTNPTLKADAGDDQLGVVGRQITLNGIRSEPRNDIGYRWVQVSGPAVGLKIEDNFIFSFVPSEPGFYRFALVVAKGEDISAPDFVNVTIGGAMDPNASRTQALAVHSATAIAPAPASTPTPAQTPAAATAPQPPKEMSPPPVPTPAPVPTPTPTPANGNLNASGNIRSSASGKLPKDTETAVRNLAAAALRSLDGGVQAAPALTTTFEMIADEIPRLNTYGDILARMSRQLDRIVPNTPGQRDVWIQRLFVPLTTTMVEVLRNDGLDLSLPPTQKQALSPVQKDRLQSLFQAVARGFQSVR